MTFQTDYGFYKYKKSMARAIIGFGAGSVTELVLPSTAKEIHKYVKAEDSIPVFVNRVDYYKRLVRKFCPVCKAKDINNLRRLPLCSGIDCCFE